MIARNKQSLKLQSKIKQKRILKKYLKYYFDLNATMPPDWVYGKLSIASMREAYDSTLNESYDVFKLSLLDRIIVKIKKFLL